MKAITVNNIRNAGYEVSKQTLIIRNNSAREGIIMNLISNIMIRDNDIKNSSRESKKSNINFDNGYNLYKNLEFGKNNSKGINTNQHMELICNRIM